MGSEQEGGVPSGAEDFKMSEEEKPIGKETGNSWESWEKSLDEKRQNAEWYRFAIDTAAASRICPDGSDKVKAYITDNDWQNMKGELGKLIMENKVFEVSAMAGAMKAILPERASDEELGISADTRMKVDRSQKNK